MQEVFKAIGRLADNSQPILIEGERGTGKKLIAKTIYSFTRSESTQLVFIGSHIGAEELVEEWLHQGFQTVHGDTAPRVTVHLEDVSVLRPQQQIRLVEYHQKLAERNSLTPTIRWVFSTSKLAHELMESGVLRSDLYYLLQSGMISVPPLRSRLADLDLLVSYFIQRLTRLQSIEPGQAPPRVSASAMDLLRSYPWPGNIAELRSVIERALIQSRGAVLLSESIPILSGMDRKLGHENSSSRSNSQSSPLKAMDMTEHFGAFVQNQLRSNTQSLYEDSVRHLEAYLIPMVLEHTQGNRAAAARLLGMTRTSLRRKLQQLSISTEDTEAPGSDMDPEERP
jgi:two-component system nitrogen regulation response regulator GlnG